MKRISGYLVRKLLAGAAFGAGILLAFVLTYFLVAPHVSYVFVPTNDQRRVDATSLPHNLNYSGLNTEEKIKVSSAIALGTYRRTNGGGNKIIIQEYLKKDPAGQLTYAVGEEVSDAISQRAASDDFGDGVVIFFVGSPTQTKMTATYVNGVIAALDNISIDDFRQRIAASR
jgi:hypothetical protein